MQETIHPGQRVRILAGVAKSLCGVVEAVEEARQVAHVRIDQPCEYQTSEMDYADLQVIDTPSSTGGHGAGKMVRRILGWLLFAWMAIAVIGGGSEAFKHAKNGTRFGTELAAVAVCAVLAGIGLTMALGKAKPPGKPTDSGHTDAVGNRPTQ